MSNTNTRPIGLALAALTLAPLAPLAGALALSTPQRVEQKLKSNDQQKLGKEVAAYFEAKTESKGIDAAFLDLTEAMEKLEKRLKGESLLAATADWEQAFFLARVEGLESNLKPRKGKVSDGTIELANGAEIGFAAAVPSSYSPKKGPFPLVLVAPAAGTSPIDALEKEWADEALLKEAIVFAAGMPEDTGAWQELNPEGGMGGIATLMSIYGQLLREFPVDMNRVYLAGSGEGVGAVLATADAFPHLFAGVVGIEATGELPQVENFRSLPTMFVGGGEAASGLAERLKGKGHTAPELAESGGATEAWAWMSQQERDAHPTELHFVPATEYTKSAYWIELVGGVDPDAKPVVDATADRESNTITITAERIPTVRVSFNDHLVDMSRPIKVIVNGVTHEQTVPRNPRTMVDLVFTRGDWGRVYTNQMPFDVGATDAE